MPRRPSLTPTTPTKVYLSQDNAANLALLTHDEDKGKTAFGEVSRIINMALAEFFSPEHKEFLEWKAQKQQLASLPSEPSPKRES
jgi:hypothetical protein